jgi:N-glycosylase/DNA lyase
VGKTREVKTMGAGTAWQSAALQASFESIGWSGWQAIPGLPPLSAEVLAETLDGGQAFRWHRQVDGTWLGMWSDNIVRLRLAADQHLEWCAPASAAKSTARSLARYLALNSDFGALTDTLPWRSDPHLAKCIVTFSGLRILRQPFGETLLGFLCSATKQIVQIKQMLALLAARHGARLDLDEVQFPDESESESANEKIRTGFHRLPTWPELAQIPEADLRSCLLGFRARYISETAQFLAANPGWLEETENLPYPLAKERLCSLPGVGEKVADCVLLFGGGRLEAFPVDVWILKTLARRYGLESWRTPQLAQFGRVHFGPLAGLAQQFLFAWERAQKKKLIQKPGSEEGRGAVSPLST